MQSISSVEQAEKTIATPNTVELPIKKTLPPYYLLDCRLLGTQRNLIKPLWSFS